MKNALSFLLIFLIVSCSEEPTSEEIKLALESDLLTMNNLKFEKNSVIPFTGASLNYELRRAYLFRNGKIAGQQFYDDDWVIVFDVGGNEDLEYYVIWYSDEHLVTNNAVYESLKDERKRGLHCEIQNWGAEFKSCRFYTDSYAIGCWKRDNWMEKIKEGEKFIDNNVDVEMCIKEFNGITQRKLFPGMDNE